MTLKDILEIAGGFFAGATISAFVTFSYTKSWYQKNHKVVQTSNKAGGNIVGGNYNQH